MNEILRKRAALILEEVWNAAGETNTPAFFAVYCNRCLTIESGDTLEELEQKIHGWMLDPNPALGVDLCPYCQVGA